MRSGAFAVLGFVVIASSKTVGLSAPFALKKAVNLLSKGDTAGLQWVVTFAALRSLAQILNHSKTVVLSLISRPLGRKLALQLYQHVLQLELRFHARRHTGALLRRLERSPRAVDTLLRAVLFTFLPVCLELCVVSKILARQGIEVAAVIVAAFAAYLCFTASVTLGWVADARQRMNRADNMQSSKAAEALIAIEQVQLFGGEGREAESFDEAQHRLQQASQSSDFAASFLSAGQQTITNTGLGLCLWLVARRVCQGRASVGDIFMTQTLVLQLWGPLQFLGFYIREAKQALVDLDSARVLLARSPAVVDPPQPEILPRASSSIPVIEFDNVSFCYTFDGPTVLDGASFSIPAGGRVALLGASGSGKSTAGSLIPRLADATGGAVRFNGIDVRQLQTAELRSRIAVVSQDVMVLNDTIRQNLLYAKPDATEEELQDALKAANLDVAVAAMPAGMETLAGERGLCLSGGERQRLSLARALLRIPELLILDEATSALDSESELAVWQALSHLDRRTAVFSITHRLSKAWQPDLVFSLEDGKVRPLP